MAYSKSGYSKKYFEAHREEITLHKAAKEAFSRLDGKIPRVKDLSAEYAVVLEEKKRAYAEYRQVKKDMQEYLTAKHNVDAILGESYKEEQTKEKQKQNNHEL